MDNIERAIKLLEYMHKDGAGSAVTESVIENAKEEHEAVISIMRTAIQYLEHPDVTAIPFALPASNISRALRNAIKEYQPQERG